MPNDGKVLCAWCGKPLLGEVSVPGDKPGWCHDCSTTYGDVAVIRCLGCGTAIGGVIPGKLENGYVVKPNQVLHVRKCPKCPDADPDMVKATIVELEEYEKAKTGGQRVG